MEQDFNSAHQGTRLNCERDQHRMIEHYNATHQIRMLIERDVASISVRLRDGTVFIVAPPLVLGDDLLRCWTAGKELRIAIADIVNVAANL